MQDLLALELVSSRKGSGSPDRLQVYRKGKAGQQEEQPLAHELRCVPQTDQVTFHALIGLSIRAESHATYDFWQSCCPGAASEKQTVFSSPVRLCV